jgi:putative membrane protein
LPREPSNKRVRDFGAMMIEDHSKAGEQLKSLAASKKVTLPKAISEDRQKKIDELRKKPVKTLIGNI